MLKRFLGQGGSSERRGSSPSLGVLEGDKLAFSAAKERARETHEPQTFVINGERFETKYDGATNLTKSLGQVREQNPA